MNEIRRHYLNEFNHVMPQAMKRAFDNMAVNEEVQFIISLLQSQYIPEWNDIYMSIAFFVHDIYVLRANLHGNAIILNSGSLEETVV